MDEVEALRRETEGGQKQLPPPIDGTTGPSPEALRAGKKKACAGLARMFGNGICKRARVSLLEDGEVDELADAILIVMEVFNFETDPRIQALGMLAFAVIGIADKRVPIIDVTPSPDAAATGAG